MRNLRLVQESTSFGGSRLDRAHPSFNATAAHAFDGTATAFFYQDPSDLDTMVFVPSHLEKADANGIRNHNHNQHLAGAGSQTASLACHFPRASDCGACPGDDMPCEACGAERVATWTCASFIAEPPAVIAADVFGRLWKAALPAGSFGGGANAGLSADPVEGLCCGEFNEGADVVGEIASGIIALAVSPDEELIAIVSGALSVIVMTSEFEVVAEHPLAADIIGDSAGGVGDDGKVASAAWISWRADGECFAVMFTLASEEESCAGRCDFVVFSRSGELENRAEKLNTLAHGEFVPGAIDWRPSGEIIATGRTILLENADLDDDGNDGEAEEVGDAGSEQRRCGRVTFHERNGLSHYHFDLPEKDGDLVDLKWSPASDVLAVVTAASVSLYHRGNYHWARKWVIPLASGTETTVMWDPAHPLSLLAVSAKEGVRRWDFRWDPATTPPQGDTAKSTIGGTVAVVDHDKIKLTPFAVANVPPPMSATEMGVDEPCEVSFLSPASSWYSNDCDGGNGSHVVGYGPEGIAVISAKGDVHLFSRYVPLAAKEFRQSPKLLTSFSSRNVSGSGSCGGSSSAKDENGSLQPVLFPRHLTWLPRGDRIIFVRTVVDDTHGDSREDEIVEVELDVKRGDGAAITAITVIGERHVTSVPRISSSGHVGCIAVHPESDSIAILAGRSVYRYHDGHLSAWALPGCGMSGSLPRPCSWAILMANGDDAGGVALVARDDRSRLYVDGTEISSECTSFASCGRNLLAYTTLSHTMKFVTVTAGMLGNSGSTVVSGIISEGAQQQQQQQQQQGEKASHSTRSADSSCRMIERGSVIVCTIPSRGRVVLQMPRGNLETVHPRALSLRTIKSLLDRGEYGEALKTMRIQRVDMNLAHDHDPEAFVREHGGAEAMVKQLDNPEIINLFLSSLREDDICTTLYENYHNLGRPVGSADSISRGGASNNSNNNNSNSITNTNDNRKKGDAEKGNDNEQSSESTSKITRACMAVREAILSLGNDLARGRFVNSLMMTYVRSVPSRLDDALYVVMSLKDPAARSSALSHLTIITDAKVLYDVALGTYDLRLALEVAQSCPAMDPRVYLPFLSSLEKIPEGPRRRYAVDEHLNRWDRALRDLIECGQEGEDDFLKLVEDRELYSIALDLLDNSCGGCNGDDPSAGNIGNDSDDDDPIDLDNLDDGNDDGNDEGNDEGIDKGAVGGTSSSSSEKKECEGGKAPGEGDNHKLVLRERVYSSFGDHLSQQANDLAPAAICYRLAGRHQDALRCHIRASEPNEAISTAYRIGVSGEELHEIVLELVETLSVEGRSAEAAFLLHSFGNTWSSSSSRTKTATATGTGGDAGSENGNDSFGLVAPTIPDVAASKAMSLAIEGGDWSFAERAGRQWGVAGVDDVIGEEATKAAGSRLSAISKTSAEWKRLHLRLGAVRDRKKAEFEAAVAAEAAAAAAAATGGGGGDGFDDAASDAFSAASSAGGSSRSMRSTSSRGGRKRALRRWDREGGPFEEDFLCASLLAMFPPAEMQREVMALVRTLLRFGRRTLANEVRTEFEAMVKMMAPEIPDLYVRVPPEEVRELKSGSTSPDFMPVRPNLPPSREVVPWSDSLQVLLQKGNEKAKK